MGYSANQNFQQNEPFKVQADTFDILHASVITFESKRKNVSQLNLQPLWLSQPVRQNRIRNCINQIVEQYYIQGE